uniref:Uncharacterized protein n=1 Tax=Ditylenchus dipsaci TaxID=166011 RepID=A0A915DUE1_9BILA
MNEYFVHRATFDKYYNCSLYDVNSIPIAERTHYFIGILQLLVASILEILHGLCLYAMTRKHIFKLDIYKMMFSLGIAQVVGMIFTTGQAQHISIFLEWSIALTLWLLNWLVLLEWLVGTTKQHQCFIVSESLFNCNNI